MTGSDRERELARILDTQGYKVIRAPSSGSATTRALPDLFFAKNGEKTAIELKYTGEDRAYYTKEEVDALKEFAAAFNAYTRLVARFKQDTTWYSIDPRKAGRTEQGNYVVHRGLDDLEEIND